MELLEKKIGGESRPNELPVVKPLLLHNTGVVASQSASIVATAPDVVSARTVDAGTQPDYESVDFDTPPEPKAEVTQPVPVERKDISVQTATDFHHYFPSSDTTSDYSKDLHADTQPAFDVVNSILNNESELSDSEGST